MTGIPSRSEMVGGHISAILVIAGKRVHDFRPSEPVLSVRGFSDYGMSLPVVRKDV
jgi:hypothetical protein